MADKNTHYRFRLTGGKTPESFQLPLKGLMLEKKDENGNSRGLKKVAYVKGHDSIFVEDHIGDEESESVWFEKGVLDVHKENKALVAIMFGHRWYGSHYELKNDTKEAEKKLSKFDLIEKAIAKLSTSNDDETLAIGLAVLGSHVLQQPLAVITASLKEKAYEEPQVLIDEMSSGDYQAKYVASLAILKGVLLINPSRTAVTWADGKTIVQVPAGQDPLTKIGMFLSQKDESARITLQEIGERTTRAYNKKTVPDVGGVVKEITGGQGADLGNQRDGGNDDDDQMTLEEASSLYMELLGKDKVPPNKKNDLDWILEKVEEAQAEGEGTDRNDTGTDTN